MAENSSMIREYQYDEETLVLEITFKKGEVYRYHQVTPEIFSGLEKADSKGRFFRRWIYGKCTYEKIADADSTTSK